MLKKISSSRYNFSCLRTYLQSTFLEGELVRKMTYALAILTIIVKLASIGVISVFTSNKNE